MTARIRPAELLDAAAIATIYEPAVTGRATSFELVPPGADEMAQRMQQGHPAHPWLVVEGDGAVIGYAYASRHRDRAAYAWSVDVSAYVRDGVHRAGIGRGLYTALLAILTLQGYRRAHAGVTLPNEASVGLHEAMGFRPVGVYESVGYKFGRWHDVAWFARSLAPLGDAPPPLSLADAARLPGYREALSAGAALIRLPGDRS
ncbi:MAG: arsinothricin resistance N-acetyltransferase ArsN1 family B [Candidatus Eisenbacteria bacterium]